MKNFTCYLWLIASLLFAQTATSAPRLSSYPSASATIFIDFDGHTVSGSYWNGGATLQCLPAALNDDQITEIFHRVAEDYRPFEVNITTDSTVFLNAPYNRRVRIIVTPTSSWVSGVGGISYIGSFTWGDDTPAFVFTDRLGPNNVKYVAECITHESGHTLGLSHQSLYDNNCNLVDQYNLGSGTGQIAWAPVMGNSYYRNMTGWNDGPTPYGCANTQDNLTIITSMNGFSYRLDDYTAERNTSTTALPIGSFDVSGIISTNDDQDAFSYNLTSTSSIHIEALPFSVGPNNAGANLDIKLSLYKDNSLIRVYDPAETMSVIIDTTLNAGTYYFVVDGSGNQNTSKYGSLGSYRLQGFNGPLPIHDVSLVGNTNDTEHYMKWSVTADEPISSQELQVSTDGIVFKTLSIFDGLAYNYSYKPNYNGMLYYRLKVVSVIHEIAYSNVIALRAVAKTERPFTVSNLVINQVLVQAPDAFRYAIYDASGRMILKGQGTAGKNYIDMYNKTNGIYVIQMFTNATKQSERIIKQ